MEFAKKKKVTKVDKNKIKQLDKKVVTKKNTKNK